MDSDGQLNIDDPLDVFMSEMADARDSTVHNLEGRDASDDDSGEDGPVGDLHNRPDVEGNRPDELERLLALAAKKARQKDLTPIDHSLIRYAPFRRSFYKETAELAKMTAAEVDHYRTALHNIRIRGINCPKPVMNWAQCGLSSGVMELLVDEFGFAAPTPVQSQTIPALMSGRDVIAVAKTGSGKTLAFVLPLLRHVSDQTRSGIGEGPIGLILTPTRELAMQTYREARRFAAAIDARIRSVCAYGGAPIAEQIADLKRGADVVVCTPGRMIDLLLANAGKVTSLTRVTFVVLDEADRMFDMGFGPQVLQIVYNIRPDRQAVLFSATFPRQMEALARRILNKPLEITVGAHSTVCEDVQQIVEIIEEDSKFLRLLTILGEWYQSRTERILIFVDRQDAADILMRDLLRRGYPCVALHGGKDQAERDQAIADFKSGVIPVLIATSIAARGLDVRNLGLVINYEPPNHREDYVHRVGRTGRAGRPGTAITFITPAQERYAPGICQALTASGVAVPESLRSLADGFTAKVQAGTAQAVSRGFGGKGLERIDKEREATIKTQKQTLLSDSDNDDEDDDDDNNGNDGDNGNCGISRKGSTASGRAVRKRVTSGTPLRTLMDTSKLPEAQRAILSRLCAAADLLESRLPPFVRFDPQREISSRFPKPDLHQSPISPSSSHPGIGEVLPVFDTSKQPPEPKEWICEIEINDYPQLTRHRIVNKETLRGVCESAGGRLVVLVKGIHVPPGRQLPSPRERRLYLRMEGESRTVVETGRNEIKRMLLQSALEIGRPSDLARLG